MPLTLDADGEVQGLVAVFEWDGAVATLAGLATGAAVADADVVAMRADPGTDFVVLGIVMDNDGAGDEVIGRRRKRWRWRSRSNRSSISSGLA